jgi:hypothetical protein
VVDAAGAIYVIGGFGGGTTFYQDVWASTDGGADWTKSGVVRVTGWVLQGYYKGTTRVQQGVSRCSKGGLEVLEG